MTILRACDVMTRRVIALAPGNDVQWALTLMTERGLRHLPVVDGDGAPLGVVTRGVAAAVSDSNTPLVAVMSRAMTLATPETTLFDVARRLRRDENGCLLVVDDGRLVGIITEADFVDRAIRDLGSPR
jgi:CBS domain-containing protein